MKDYIILIISSILAFSCQAQEELHGGNFDKEVVGVSIVQFNSDWNTDNSFDLNTLKDCNIFQVIICDNPKLQEKYNIKSVPTLIIYDSGIEVVRFEANLMMELSCYKKDVQKEIQKIYLAKFE